MKKIYFVTFILCLVFSSCKKDDPIDPVVKGCAPILENEVRCKALLPICDEEKKSISDTCLGKTTTNAPCKNLTLNKCGYCHLHVNQNEGRCPKYTRNECEYCYKHTDQYQPNNVNP